MNSEQKLTIWMALIVAAVIIAIVWAMTLGKISGDQYDIEMARNGYTHVQNGWVKQ